VEWLRYNKIRLSIRPVFYERLPPMHKIDLGSPEFDAFWTVESDHQLINPDYGIHDGVPYVEGDLLDGRYSLYVTDVTLNVAEMVGTVTPGAYFNVTCLQP
jgi:hypothetical protein